MKLVIPLSELQFADLLIPYGSLGTMDIKVFGVLIRSSCYNKSTTD